MGSYWASRRSRYGSRERRRDSGISVSHSRRRVSLSMRPISASRGGRPGLVTAGGLQGGQLVAGHLQLDAVQVGADLQFPVGLHVQGALGVRVHPPVETAVFFVVTLAGQGEARPGLQILLQQHRVAEAVYIEILAQAHAPFQQGPAALPDEIHEVGNEPETGLGLGQPAGFAPVHFLAVQGAQQVAHGLALGGHLLADAQENVHAIGGHHQGRVRGVLAGGAVLGFKLFEAGLDVLAPVDGALDAEVARRSQAQHQQQHDPTTDTASDEPFLGRSCHGPAPRANGE